METCEISDSSLNLACSAVYARFKRKNGLYSCQLVFARENWYYINSKNNIADLGTKRRAKLSDVLDNSIWVNGHDWGQT